MFIVLEFMLDANGNPGHFFFTYDNMAEAKAKYHAILSAAALSNTRVHSASIMNEDLMTMCVDSFHNIDEAQA